MLVLVGEDEEDSTFIKINNNIILLYDHSCETHRHEDKLFL